MEKTNTSANRKKFIWFCAGAIAFLNVSRFFGSKKEKKSETAKMLTQDGQLVEVDKSLLAQGSRRISNDELQQWIKTK